MTKGTDTTWTVMSPGRRIANMARQLAVPSDESRRFWRLTAHGGP
jgi:hypothetical protein